MASDSLKARKGVHFLSVYFRGQLKFHVKLS